MAEKEKKKLDTGFYVNLIYFIVVASFVVIRICANLGLFSFLGAYGNYILSIITQVGLIFLLPFFLFKCFSKQKTKEVFGFFSFKKISAKAVVISVVLGLVVFCLNIYASTFFNSIIQALGYKPNDTTSTISGSWWVLILDLLCTAVLPAICEETLHRGMLLRGNSYMGTKKSIIISGFLFGLLHLNIEQFFYATLIGLFLGYLCWTCSSIYPCIIIHFMNNAISVFLSFARAKGWAIGNVFKAISTFLSSNAILGFAMFFLVLCLLVFVGWELTRLLFKESFNYSFGKKQKELASMAIRENYFQQIDDLKNNKEEKDRIYESNGNMVVVDAKEFLDFVDKNMEMIVKKASEFEEKNNKKKVNKKTLVFICGSFILSAVITIMTFIWGLL